MVDKDLETLFGETPKFIINNKEYSLKDLEVEQHLKTEFHAQKIDQRIKMPFEDEKDIKTVSKEIREYITTIFEITPAEASKVKFNDYKRIRKWLNRQDLYDQGFNDQEIDRLEKESTTTAFQKALQEGTSDAS